VPPLEEHLLEAALGARHPLPHAAARLTVLDALLAILALLAPAGLAGCHRASVRGLSHDAGTPDDAAQDAIVTDAAPRDAPSSDKDITRFTILGNDADIRGTEITLTAPIDVDIGWLAPIVTITGASVSPASGEAQNFANDVIYTVTAADSSTKDYVVRVRAGYSSQKEITGFTIMARSGHIGADTITLALPEEANLMYGLIPTITYTGVSLSPESGVMQDFTSPVVYTVTAEDLSTKQYTAIVSHDTSSHKYITRFTILGVDGYIRSSPDQTAVGPIALELPTGTALTGLTPTITFVGAHVAPPSGFPQDFTSPVTYAVTAVDGSYRQYVVTVTATSCTTVPCPADMVPLPPYCICIDRYEASHGDGGVAVSVAGAMPWQSRTKPQAAAACAAAGKRLCTLLEWQAACAGPAPGSYYPYGDGFDPHRCNVYSNGAGLLPTGSMTGCEGGYPGLSDMSGNVWEWTSDCETEHPDACWAVGGSCAHSMMFTDLSDCQTPVPFTGWSSDIGFRCCRDP
jgi:formylglycine-generating enzyme required for sulfatase activity